MNFIHQLIYNDSIKISFTKGYKVGFMDIYEVINNIDIQKELIEVRRYLHQNPELSLKEYNSQKYIVSKLKDFGLEEVYDNIYETSVMAIIRGKNPGKTILIRADMDALPIMEDTNLDFSSINKGVMHACGHDVHMTWGLGCAFILNKIKDKLDGNVKILFQPAEEGEGGADSLLHNYDILNIEPKVDFAIAGHCWPSIQVGKLALVDGCAMAAANKFKITIIGKGGHGAEPHKTIDPISLANQVYMSIQNIKSRKLSPFSHSVVTIGVFKGIGSFNVIPNTVELEGTVRGDSYEEVMDIMKTMEKMVSGIVISQGGDYKLKIDKPIHAVHNNSELVKESYKILKDKIEIDILKTGAMTGEDFCYISNKVPSLYFYVGTSTEGDNPEQNITNAPLHNPKLCINEDVLSIASKAFSYLAYRLISQV